MCVCVCGCRYFFSAVWFRVVRLVNRSNVPWESKKIKTHTHAHTAEFMTFVCVRSW